MFYVHSFIGNLASTQPYVTEFAVLDEQLQVIDIWQLWIYLFEISLPSLISKVLHRFS